MPPSSRARRRPGAATILVATIAAVLLASAARPARAADRDAPPDPGQIGLAINKARSWLLSQQRQDGSWECAMRTEDTRVGATALVSLALLNAGVSPKDPAMQRTLGWLRKQTPGETYSVSLQTMVLAMVAAGPDRVLLERNVKWLELAQISLVVRHRPRDR